MVGVEEPALTILFSIQSLSLSFGMAEEKEKTISVEELASFANGLDWDKCMTLTSA
jgi:hypothetical protein